jgi:guanine deaminase
MSDLLIRGRVLTFVREPEGIDDTPAYRLYEDGAVLVADGKVAAVGPYGDVAKQGGNAKVADHRPHLVLPGFIDTHLHFPQTQAIASYGAQLLEWLNTYIFVEEQKFKAPEHAAFIAGRFMDELLSNGTTTAVAYCSVHPESVDAFFTAAEKRNMLMIGGKVMMDRNAPDALRDTPQSGYDETKHLIAKWHGRGRAHYAISPRFAITSTPEQMEMSRALAAEHSDCYVQTHLSENKDEIAFAMSLYPEAKDYTNIYASYGLLGRKTLLGHCIHLSDREIFVLAETGAVGVFCPTSNLFLGSGLFDRDRFDQLGARYSVATDVGAGTKLLDAGNPGRGLQGAAPAGPAALAAQFLLHDDARQCPSARPRASDRLAACRRGRRHRRPRQPRQTGDGIAHAGDVVSGRRALHPSDDGRRPLGRRGLCGRAADERLPLGGERRAG